jgi:hypothetical protein
MSEQNKEFMERLMNLVSQEWDPDCIFEYEVVEHIQDSYPAVVEMAAKNQSLDEGEEIEMPTLSRVAECISKKDEDKFFKLVKEFYLSRA